MSEQKEKILIVDDSELDRNTLAAVLKKKGFEPVCLSNGVLCLEAVENNKPDAILLDIIMPKMQGKEVVHKIREKYNSIELPIIMVTSKSDASDVIETLQLGANDYIIKPVDFDITVMRLQTHLKIADLSKHLVRLKELEAIQGMVATYNHEINNPLAIALGTLKKLERNDNQKDLKTLQNSMWRIADIVKKIEDATFNYSVEYENYNGGSTKMVKIK